MRSVVQGAVRTKNSLLNNVIYLCLPHSSGVLATVLLAGLKKLEHLVICVVKVINSINSKEMVLTPFDV